MKMSQKCSLEPDEVYELHHYYNLAYSWMNVDAASAAGTSQASSEKANEHSPLLSPPHRAFEFPPPLIE